MGRNGDGREFSCGRRKGDTDCSHSTFGDSELFTILFFCKFETVGDCLWGDGLDKYVDGGDFFKFEGAFEGAGSVESWPADVLTVDDHMDGKAQGTEEFVFGIFHPSVEIRKMDDAGHIRFGKFNLSCGGEGGHESEVGGQRSGGGVRLKVGLVRRFGA